MNDIFWYLVVIGEDVGGFLELFLSDGFVICLKESWGEFYEYKMRRLFDLERMVFEWW